MADHPPGPPPTPRCPECDRPAARVGHAPGCSLGRRQAARQQEYREVEDELVRRLRERRQDHDFVARLRRRMIEDKQILDRLADWAPPIVLMPEHRNVKSLTADGRPVPIDMATLTHGPLDPYNGGLLSWEIELFTEDARNWFLVRSIDARLVDGTIWAGDVLVTEIGPGKSDRSVRVLMKGNGPPTVDGIARNG